MENEKIFKTKTGFCHILPDKIILTRDGVIGNVARITVGNNINRILIIYAGLSVFILLTIIFYFKEDFSQSIFFGILTAYLIYGILSSLNNSITPIIERNKIKSVNLKKAIFGLTRSRFEVKFEDENGKIKKRLIMLPGSMNKGQNETDKAIEIMTVENLLGRK